MQASMDEIKVLWIIVFFIFTLILIFTWSKILVISRKLGIIINLIKKCDDIKAQDSNKP